MKYNDVPYTGPERRINRITIPPCERCGSREPVVIARLADALSMRCSVCAHVWTVAKSGAESI
jgi:hypothetical protein